MLKKYRVTLTHDDGVIRIVTVASSSAVARRIVARSEGAPERAITKVEAIS